jgi:hypothetical protein
MSSVSSGRGRGWLAGGLLALATVAGVLAVGRPGGDRPLSPRSDERLGTSALVALAGELGADVEIGDRLPELGDEGEGESREDRVGPDVIVLLQDLLDDDQRTVLEDWVDGGGTLVVTDPASAFTPQVVDDFDATGDLGPARTLGGDCQIDALGDVDVAGVEPRHGGVLYEPPAGSDACLSDGSGAAYIVATDQGSGTVVALGGAGLLVNAALAEGENAPVAAALVAPEQGTELLVLEPGPLAGGNGGRSLADLVSPGVKRALVQLGLAFAVYALWRARRLGRPVAEPQPVAVAGSELVAAVGTLLDRSRSPQHAADLLRADLRRFLADRLGVPAGAPSDTLAAVAAARTGTDEAMLRWALGPAPIADDAGLVALADTIDRIRQEVTAHV